MSATPFETTAEFQKHFDLESNKEYFDPIPLTDRKVAFSIKRHYPSNIRYKPAYTKAGKPDNVAAIWVVYTHPSESEKPLNLGRVPVQIHVEKMSLYRSKHLDYDFDDDESPTQDSLEVSASTPKPIGLDYSNEFFFDHHRNTFIDENGNSLKGIDLLDRVFTEHCNTVHWLWGLRLRVKRSTKSKLVELISALITLLKFIMKQAFGRTLEERDSISASTRGYKREALKKLGEDSLKVVGYKAAKRVIILFCGVVIVVSLWRYFYGCNGGYLGYVASSNFLSVIHGLFLLWFLDVVIPNLLFLSVNGLIKLRMIVIFMGF